jgi:hypothetical protein
MDNVLGILGTLALALGGLLAIGAFLGSGGPADTINGIALISASVGLFAFASIIKLLKEIRDILAASEDSN